MNLYLKILKNVLAIVLFTISLYKHVLFYLVMYIYVFLLCNVDDLKN